MSYKRLLSSFPCGAADSATARSGDFGDGLRSASRVALWTFAAVGVSQLGFIVTSRVLTRSTHLAEEQGLVVAGKLGYSNAFLLFMLPHSLVTVSLVTALFTGSRGLCMRAATTP